ncbi:Ig-like domain-containing protein [Methanobrevibacter sp.]
MFYKKISLTLIILVFILSVSAVAASDVNGTDDVIASDVDEEPPSGISDVSADEIIASNTQTTYSMEANDITMYYTGQSKYTATLTKNGNPLKSVPVNFWVNGQTYTVNTDSNGKASFLIKNLDLGTYKVSAAYGHSATSKNTVTVLSTIQSSDLVKYYTGSQSYHGTFLDNNGNPLKNTDVNFVYKGTTYTRTTNSNGYAGLTIGSVPGTYSIKAINPVTSESVTNTIKVLSTIQSSNLQKYYSSTTSYSPRFYDRNGNPLKNTDVNFVYRGTAYTRTTNSNGYAGLTIGSLPGTYSIKAINPVTSESVTNTIKVLSTIQSSNLQKYYSNSAPYKPRFFDKNGNPLKNTDVKFVYRGNTYIRTTNSNGFASLNIGSQPGTYTIQAINTATSESVTNTIKVLSTIKSSDFEKHYLSAKVFSAKFYDANGKALANSNIQYYTGSYYTIKTDANGVAKISVNSVPGDYSIKLTNLATGESKTNKIKVLSPVEAPATMTTFAGVNTKYQATLYTSESLAKNKDMNIYVDGTKHTVTTDSNGVASLTFKFSAKGTYYIKAVDPRTGYIFKTKVVVKPVTITASDVTAVAGHSSKFTVHLLNENGNAAKYTQMKITINGVAKTVVTDEKGEASYTFNLPEGTYNAVSEDLNTGYKLTKKIHVLAEGTAIYDKNGVSLDGTTLLVIGRPSTGSEESQYGYTFYKTKILRTCSYCGSHDLYWSIFFAGNEYTNVGVFPATGYKEGGSAEGIIICKDCDSDWSIFGHNHGGGGGDLTVISGPVKTTKQDAYDLLEGNYVAT